MVGRQDETSIKIDGCTTTSVVQEITTGSKRSSVSVSSTSLTQKGLEQNNNESTEAEADYITLCPSTYVARRGPMVAASSGTYDGVFYRNHFMVKGGPIYLIGVNFYGPADGGAYVESYVEVTTPVWEENTQWSLHQSCLPRRVQKEQLAGRRSKTLRTETVKQGGDFYVQLTDQVLIYPDAWVEIGFTLSPHIWTKLRCMKDGQQYLESSVETECGTRSFEFLPGSKQMPTLVFTVKDLKDSRNYKVISRVEAQRMGIL